MSEFVCLFVCDLDKTVVVKIESVLCLLFVCMYMGARGRQMLSTHLFMEASKAIKTESVYDHLFDFLVVVRHCLAS